MPKSAYKSLDVIVGRKDLILAVRGLDTELIPRRYIIR